MKMKLCKYFRGQSIILGAVVGLSATMGAPTGVLAGQLLWSTSTNINFPPQIDATNFNNSATWNISTSRPFTTADTLNYTNTGSMNGSVGWEFDLGPTSTGARGWANSFLNKNSSSLISASAGFNGIGGNVNGANAGYIWISATNVVNQGQLSADVNSEIKIQGKDVNLSRSFVTIQPAVNSSSFNNFSLTNYTPSVGIYDLYWGQAGITNMDSRTIWNGSSAVSAPFHVAEPGGITNLLTQITLQNITAVDSTNFEVPQSYTNLTVTNQAKQVVQVKLATNVIREAVFIYTGDSNMTAQVRFSPGTIPTNYFQTVAVQVSDPYFDVVNRTMKTNDLYLVDNLASTTNRGLLPNYDSSPYAGYSDTTFRPANYNLSRTDPGAFSLGQPGQGEPTNDFFDSPSFTNALVSADYAGYSAYINNQAYPPQTLANTFVSFGGVLGNSTGGAYSISNIPGRVKIDADNLNLKDASLRGEGSIVVDASNLITSAGAVVDCQNLSYNLGATNGHLTVTGLVPPTVHRLQGRISCWSAVWHNSETVTTPNYTTNGVNVPLTNSVDVGLYVLIVDASQLKTELNPQVQHLTLHSTNMVVDDSVDLVDSLLFDGENLTLNGNLSLFDQVTDWNHNIAPNLLNFTNNAVLDISGGAFFGDQGNYNSFVNTGSIYSSGQSISSDYLEVSGGTEQTLGGDFVANAKSAQLNGANISSFGNIQFNGSSLSLGGADIISANNGIYINVTNSLTDSGAGAGNLLVCRDGGFHLMTKPAAGGLLGTTISSVAQWGGAIVKNQWAASDLGATTAGFVNNAGLNTLVLMPTGNTNSYPPLFEFSGTGADNGLYVSNLDLSMLTDYTNELQVDPSLTIYYVNAFLNTNSVDTSGKTANQFLDGQFGGHLRWIQGVTSAVTAAPAVATQFTLTTSLVPASGKIKITGSIYPGETNLIEASTDLVNWLPIYTNMGSYSNVGPSTIIESNTKQFRQRFYRVVPVK